MYVNIYLGKKPFCIKVINFIIKNKCLKKTFLQNYIKYNGPLIIAKHYILSVIKLMYDVMQILYYILYSNFKMENQNSTAFLDACCIQFNSGHL